MTFSLAETLLSRSHGPTCRICRRPGPPACRSIPRVWHTSTIAAISSREAAAATCSSPVLAIATTVARSIATSSRKIRTVPGQLDDRGARALRWSACIFSACSPRARVEKTKVAIVGLGTVGTGVARLLLDYGDRTARHAGRTLWLEQAVVKDLKKRRDVDLPAGLVSTDLSRITG